MESGGSDVLDAGLLNPTAGWVQTSDGIETTSDGGAHWLDVTPPQPPADPSGTSPIGAVFFLDPSHAWEASLGDSQMATVFRSTDGGNTWASTEVRMPVSLGGDVASPDSIAFVDPSNGWLAADLGTNSNFSPGALFHSSDGGATWSELSIPIGSVALRFVTPAAGWAEGGAGGGRLYRTLDGGSTWTQIALPAPAKYDQGATIYGLPWFSDPRNGVLPATLVGNEVTGLGFYVTRDGGDTWTLASTVDASETAGPATFPFQALTPTQWVAMLSGAQQVMWTTNAGQSWISGNVSGLEGAGPLKASFADVSTGWTVAEVDTCTGFKTGCSSQDVLLATSDGGQTWTQLHP